MVELNLNLLADIGGWPALKEARALVAASKVRAARREDNVIRATVQGAEKSYEPRITLSDRVANVTATCTCVESRRSGKVCAHALAAGVAFLEGRRRSPDTGTQPIATHAPEKLSSPILRLPRVLIEEAPAGTPHLELTVLLPLQLKDALKSTNDFRIILEAKRGNETLPFDTATKNAKLFSVSEPDDQLLTALESTTGTAAGINAVPRAKLPAVLRALNSHPHVWIGKKQRIEVHAAKERPQILASMREDGSLFVSLSKVEGPSLRGWNFDGANLVEGVSLPAGFSSLTRNISREKIPDFLSRELPTLERDYDLTYAPGFEEIRLEMPTPEIEARLDGALSGLTLEIVARYGDKEFILSAGESDRSYFPAPKQNIFWQRNIAAEITAIKEAEAAGFARVRGNSSTLSITKENQVARFLANSLPRWRREWTVKLGSRLTSVLSQVDIAEPEFVLRGGSGEDWLSLDLKLAVGGKPVPLDAAEIQRWLQTGQSHTRTTDGRTLLVPTEAWSEMQDVLADCEVDQEPGKIRVARELAPYLSGSLTAQGFSGRVPEAQAPPNVKAALGLELWNQLRPYQAHGVEWLATLAAQKFCGLLADDMGLGKTLQALAFASWLSSKNSSQRILVVCPTSLVTNWQREAARFVPNLRALDLTGSNRAEKFTTIADHDLLITSYAILRRDIEFYRAQEFSLVVLDEAQHIKNRTSQNAQAAKALRAQHRLILTGTPLENSLLDLWSLFDFLLPGYLGHANDFRERYETPLAKGAPDPRTMQRLRQRVKPFFLRRTKEEVLTDLPPKLDFPALVELTAEQREVYRAVLEQGRRDVFDRSDKAGRKSGRDRIAVLTTLLRLRQVCCHLDLLPGGDTPRKWSEPSAKMDRTFELIDEAIDGGHRVLLFSQFVRVLHLLRDEAKRRDLQFCYLDGQTVERQAEVDRFQSEAGIPIFFISLKAGGTGLNLTGADTVIHFDPWWNPAVEEQATSRAHRLGQSRRVQAYKLIAAGTVEEKIKALQARKRELFEASLAGDEAFVEKLTGDEIEDLLT